MLKAALVLMLIIAAANALDAVLFDEKFRITVRPQIMISRSDMRIEVVVPPNERNRMLSISWDSDRGTAGSTLRTIDGENGPVIHELEIRSAPPANYVFVAVLFDAHGKRIATTTARVSGPEVDR